MAKCACEMTTAELLVANVAGRPGIKAVLIEDTGRGWKATPYAPSQAGLGTEHVTVQSAIVEIERLMVEIRRDDEPEPQLAGVVTDPAEVAKLLSGKTE